jgi:hypothetical protein
MFKHLLGNCLRTKQVAVRRHAACMTVVAVMCVGALTPGYSLGSTELAGASSRSLAGKRGSGSSASAERSRILARKRAWGSSASAEHCHFSLDDKMSMAEGTFGKGVHDPGPGYRCWERQNEEQR